MGRQGRSWSFVVLVALAVLTGCSDRLNLVAPERAAYWGLVALDGENQVVAGTPLQTVDDRLEFELPLGHRALLLTYGPGLLARLGVEALGGERLAAVHGCALRLAEPDTLYSVLDDALVQVPVEVLPPVTAAWLGNRCEGSGLDDLVVDSGCVPSTCSVRPTREGCLIRVDAAVCAVAPFSVRVGPTQDVCVDTGDCVPEPSTPDTVAALRCRRLDQSGDCPVRVFRRAPFPDVSVETVRPVDFPLRVPPGATYDPEIVRDGYLNDLLVTEERVFVTSLTEPDARRDLCRFRTRRQRLHIYSKDDLAVLLETILPRCALAPLELPGDRILAFTVDEALSALLTHELDFEGRFVRTTTAAFPFFGYATVIESLRLGPDQNVVLVGSNEVRAGALMMVRDDGTEVWMVELSLNEPSGLAAFRGGFVVTDSNRDRFMAFGSDGTERESVFIIESQSMDLAAPHLHGLSGTLVAPIPRDLHQVALLDSELNLHERRPANFERDGAPTAVSDWPPDPRLVLIGLSVEAPEPEAYLARLDPVAGHYLPGLLPVGPGAPAAMETDKEGRVYVLLSWAGQLVRLRPL